MMPDLSVMLVCPRSHVLLISKESTVTGPCVARLVVSAPIFSMVWSSSSWHAGGTPPRGGGSWWRGGAWQAGDKDDDNEYSGKWQAGESPSSGWKHHRKWSDDSWDDSKADPEARGSQSKEEEKKVEIEFLPEPPKIVYVNKRQRPPKRVRMAQKAAALQELIDKLPAPPRCPTFKPPEPKEPPPGVVAKDGGIVDKDDDSITVDDEYTDLANRDEHKGSAYEGLMTGIIWVDTESKITSESTAFITEQWNLATVRSLRDQWKEVGEMLLASGKQVAELTAMLDEIVKNKEAPTTIPLKALPKAKTMLKMTRKRAKTEDPVKKEHSAESCD